MKQLSSFLRRLAIALTLAASTIVAPAAPAQPGPVRQSLADLPAPVMQWQRRLEISQAEARPGWFAEPFHNLLAFAAGADGGAVIVARQPLAAGGEQPYLLTLRGEDGAASLQRIDLPASIGSGNLRSAAVNAEAGDRSWVFLTLEVALEGGGAATRSALIGFDAAGRRSTATALPERLASQPASAPQRDARFLRRLPDGSLLAGGTVAPGPPYWWFARFTVGGRLLHEQASRFFPDYIQDAIATGDGGYALLMVDALGGREAVAIRRYDAMGRLARRDRLPELPQSHLCAIALSADRHLRVLDIDGSYRSELILHQLGRGILARTDLGALYCEDMRRLDSKVVITASLVPNSLATSLAIGLIDGQPRWQLRQPGAMVATPTGDGGALVLQAQGEGNQRQIILTRYRLP